MTHHPDDMAPCPFCGVRLVPNTNQADLYVRRYGTHYDHPPADCPLSEHEVSPAGIEAWNRRTAQSSAAGDGAATEWKLGNEFAPFHPDASHVEPGYRDGWNACYRAAAFKAIPAEREKGRLQGMEQARAFSPNIKVVVERDGGQELHITGRYIVSGVDTVFVQLPAASEAQEPRMPLSEAEIEHILKSCCMTRPGLEISTVFARAIEEEHGIRSTDSTASAEGD